VGFMETDGLNVPSAARIGPAEVEAHKRHRLRKNKYHVGTLTTSMGKILLDFLTRHRAGTRQHDRARQERYYEGGGDNLLFPSRDFGVHFHGGCRRNRHRCAGLQHQIRVSHDVARPGVLSMARTADPNSSCSQFFICLGTLLLSRHKYRPTENRNCPIALKSCAKLAPRRRPVNVPKPT